MTGRGVENLLVCFGRYVGMNEDSQRENEIELTTYPVVPKGTISLLCC